MATSKYDRIAKRNNGFTGSGIALIDKNNHLILGSHAKHKTANDFGGTIENIDTHHSYNLDIILANTATRECKEETKHLVNITPHILSKCSYYNIKRWDDTDYLYRVYFVHIDKIDTHSFNKIYTKDFEEVNELYTLDINKIDTIPTIPTIPTNTLTSTQITTDGRKIELDNRIKQALDEYMKYII